MINTYQYKKVDAFTADSSLGNPAACLYFGLEERLEEEMMLEIAKQHKGFVSEVVYCCRSGPEIHLTYYSSECEVDFCGHGTIACMYTLIQDNPELLSKEKIIIKTNKKGVLTVYNQIPDRDCVLITAPPLYIGTHPSVGTIAESFGISVGEISSQYPIDLIDAGLRTLIVPISGLETEVSVFPNEQLLRDFCANNEIDIILIFSKDVTREYHLAHTRVFAPKFGYLEDPATGSGNSAFGYYMLKNRLWNGDDCVVGQGGNDRVPNDIFLSCQDGTVLFGGSATVRIDGSYLV